MASRVLVTRLAPRSTPTIVVARAISTNPGPPSRILVSIEALTAAASCCSITPAPNPPNAIIRRTFLTFSNALGRFEPLYRLCAPLRTDGRPVISLPRMLCCFQIVYSSCIAARPSRAHGASTRAVVRCSLVL